MLGTVPGRIGETPFFQNRDRLENPGRFSTLHPNWAAQTNNLRIAGAEHVSISRAYRDLTEHNTNRLRK